MFQSVILWWSQRELWEQWLNDMWGISLNKDEWSIPTSSYDVISRPYLNTPKQWTASFVCNIIQNVGFLLSTWMWIGAIRCDRVPGGGRQWQQLRCTHIHSEHLSSLTSSRLNFSLVFFFKMSTCFFEWRNWLQWATVTLTFSAAFRHIWNVRRRSFVSNDWNSVRCICGSQVSHIIILFSAERWAQWLWLEMDGKLTSLLYRVRCELAWPHVFVFPTNNCHCAKWVLSSIQGI